MWLVTGASGFLGSHLCRRLEESGRPYRALVRNPAKAIARGIPEAKLLEADLGGELGPEVFDGIDAVLHLAGLLRGRSEAELCSINRSATDRLARGFERQKPSGRFVLVSSLAAAGPSADGSGTDALPESARPVSAYGRSKLAGETALVERDLSWNVLRPAIVYGPWDSDVLILFKMLDRGLTPLVGPRVRYSLVHGDDVAVALIAAADSPNDRVCMPVAHPEVLEQEDWLQRMARGLGRERARLLKLPRAAAWLSAASAELWGRLRNSPATFGLDKYREMRQGSWVADTEPAREHIGFVADIAHDDGFASTAAWYREQGWLPPKARP